MPVTQADVMRWLMPEEPHYTAAAAALGGDAAPVLLAMLPDADPELAARLVSLAAAIGDAARPVVEAGARHASPIVRVQAAAAAPRIAADAAGALLPALVNDVDVSVRRFAVAAAARAPLTPALRTALEQVRANDAHDFLRDRAATTLAAPPSPP